MSEAVIVDAIRTPLGKKNGSLANWRPDDLAAQTIKALIGRNNLNPALIDDVILGCVTQVQDQGWNIARNAALAAGLPISVPGTTVNRLCGSSLQACNFAAQAVKSSDMSLIIAGGVESMTRVPMGSDAGSISSKIMDRFDLVSQGISAEMIAEKWGFSRRQIDEFSLRSHEKARKNSHLMALEQIPIAITPDTNFLNDEGPRVSTIEKMSALKAAFKEGGVITAGNSSQISDGAASLLIANRAYAHSTGMNMRARFVASAVVGVDPTIMLTGPIPATRKVLDKAELRIEDIDLFECNEAFAPVVMAWMKELNIDESRVNVNGGAIALGHPLGCSGARLLTSLLYEMERRGSKYGLTTMCIGMGQGIATIIQRI